MAGCLEIFSMTYPASSSMELSLVRCGIIEPVCRWKAITLQERSFPKVQKVCLHMGMENVVKDMPSIVDDSWTYSDLLIAESQIIKVLQPILFLDPKLSLDRLCRSPFSKQLDLGICKGGLSRKQPSISEVNLNSTDTSDSRDISNYGCTESLTPQTRVSPAYGTLELNLSTSSSFGDGTVFSAPHAMSRSMPYVQLNGTMKNVLEPSLLFASQPNYDSAVSCSSTVPHDASINSSSVSAPDQNSTDSCVSLNDSTELLGKGNRYQRKSKPPRERPKQVTLGPSSLQFSCSQRECLPKQEVRGLNSRQFSFSQRDNLQGKDSLLDLTVLQMQEEAQGTENPGIHDSSYRQSKEDRVVAERITELEAQGSSLLYGKGVQCNIEECIEPKNLFKMDIKKDKENRSFSTASNNSNQKRSLPSTRSLPLMQCNITALPIVDLTKKATASRKRKLTQGLQVSGSASVSHSVTKLGENQKASLRAPNSECSNVSPALATSPENACLASGNNISLSEDNQLPLQPKKKIKLHDEVTAPFMSGSRLAAVVHEADVPCSSTLGDSSVPPMSGSATDPAILHRLSTIDMVTKRYGLSSKKNTDEKNLMRESLSHSPFPPTEALSSGDIEECRSLTDKLCMSKYLISENRNVCKARSLTFASVRCFFQRLGNPMAAESRVKLILSESENLGDHKIGAEIIFGDDQRFHIAILPSPHYADLFAAQFTSLMIREGFILKDDQIQPTQISTPDACSTNSLYGSSSGFAELPCTTPVILQSLAGIPVGTNFYIMDSYQFSPQIIPTTTRMHPCWLNLTREHLLEMASRPSSTQPLFLQNQNPLLLMRNYTWDTSNLQMSNQMSDSSTSVQFLPPQKHQQQQYQQQAVMQSLSRLGARGGESSMSRRFSGSNVTQFSHSLQQIPGFSRADQFIDRENSQAQATVVAKRRQTPIQAMQSNVGSKRH